MNTKEQQWQRLSDEVTRRGGNGNDVVEAYKELYSVHNEEGIATWLGGLFDPDIGGFYYSNSARDNEYGEYNGEKHYFLPDIESTNQATNFLMTTRMIGSCMELPEWMRKKIIAFNCSLQDPDDGFIYHPQWGKNIRQSRRGRDLMWSVAMEEKFNFKLPYPTANERLKAGLENPDKKDEIMASLPDYFKSRDAYNDYLCSFNWDEKAYAAGNTLAAQGDQIVAAGLADATVDFLNSIQNKDTGIWGKKTGYDATNGILKITCFYEMAKKPIPNPLAVAMSAMDCITLDTRCETVCWQYNAWYSVRNIINNLRTFGGEEGNKTADGIVTEMLRRAPDGIRATAKKVRTFVCDDGSYSYTPEFSSSTSQASRVSLGLKEGDVNATVINCTGVIHNSLRALELNGLYVPLFGKTGYEKFLSAVRLPKDGI